MLVPLSWLKEYVDIDVEAKELEEKLFSCGFEVEEMADTIKVTLVKSPIGAVPKHKKTVKAMGLTKMHKTVEMPDNAATRGMIQQVQHLVKVEEA